MKPHVTDAFEGDPNQAALEGSSIMTMRSEGRGENCSKNMIAAEKLSSPTTVIRNKHVKTMTQLLGGVGSPPVPS